MALALAVTNGVEAAYRRGHLLEKRRGLVGPAVGVCRQEKAAMPGGATEAARRAQPEGSRCRLELNAGLTTRRWRRRLQDRRSLVIFRFRKSRDSERRQWQVSTSADREPRLGQKQQ